MFSIIVHDLYLSLLFDVIESHIIRRTTSSNVNPSTSLTAIVAGSVASVFVVILLLILGIIFWRKKKPLGMIYIYIVKQFALLFTTALWITNSNYDFIINSKRIAFILVYLVGFHSTGNAWSFFFQKKEAMWYKTWWILLYLLWYTHSNIISDGLKTYEMKTLYSLNFLIYEW